MSKLRITSTQRKIPVAEQYSAYRFLLQNLGTASFEQIQKALRDCEPAKPERGLTPEVVEKLKKRMKKKL